MVEVLVIILTACCFFTLWAAFKDTKEVDRDDENF